MIDDIRKSINSILYERVSSPFYGTIIISWLIINWRIPYLTLFVDQDKLDKNKIDFIIDNYCSFDTLVIFPAISTFSLLTVIPFITNGAYWLDLKFKTWRVNKRNEIEGKQLLTMEQSIRFRTEMRELEESFDKLLEKKDEEIKTLKSELGTKRLPNSDNVKTSKRATRTGKGSNYSYSDFTDLRDNQKLYKVFEEIAKSLKDTNQFPKDINEKIKEYYLVNEIVDEDLDAWGNKTYFLTYKGEEIYKEHFNNAFKSEN
ncbi:MAG: hypothetical protein ACKO96_38120 [Flammeovirgaceae bacterium]